MQASAPKHQRKIEVKPFSQYITNHYTAFRQVIPLLFICFCQVIPLPLHLLSQVIPLRYGQEEATNRTIRKQIERI